MEEVKYYSHYTPDQLDMLQVRLAAQYRRLSKQYRWMLVHPGRYTVAQIEEVYKAREGTWLMMVTLVPEPVVNEIAAMVADAEMAANAGKFEKAIKQAKIWIRKMQNWLLNFRRRNSIT